MECSLDGSLFTWSLRPTYSSSTAWHFCLYNGRNGEFSWAEFPHRLTLKSSCITGYVNDTFMWGHGNRNGQQALCAEADYTFFVPRRSFCLLWLLGQAVTGRSLVYTCEMPRGEAGVPSLDNLDNSVHHVRHTTSVRKRSIKCGLQTSDGQGGSCQDEF